MIHTGVDIVSVSRLQAALARSPRLADRLFTAEEQRYAATRPHPMDSLAVRFAAKEAAFKALGKGWPRLSWLEVEVVKGPAGRPCLALHGRAAAVAGDARLSVSLAHDGGMAIATVIVEGLDA